MLKPYILLLTILYSIALTTVCLVQVNGIVSEVRIPFGDKIFHFLAYVVLTVLWYNTVLYKYHTNKSKALIYAVIISIIFGIIIEVLQGTITTVRSSDINDVFANTVGALLAAAVIKAKNKYRLK